MTAQLHQQHQGGERPISERSPITECVEGGYGGVVDGALKEADYQHSESSTFCPVCPLLPSTLTEIRHERQPNTGRVLCSTTYLPPLPVLCDCSPLRRDNVLTPAPAASIPQPHDVPYWDLPQTWNIFQLWLCFVKAARKLSNLLKKSQQLLKCSVLFLSLPVKQLLSVELKL